MAQKLEFRLHIKSPDSYQDFTVPMGSTTIGRDPSANLPLVFPLVSRRHAQLVRTDDECTLADLGSANGTIVNDVKLEPNIPVKLTDKALVLIGPFEITCEVVILEPAEAEAAPEATVAEPRTIGPIPQEARTGAEAPPATVPEEAEAPPVIEAPPEEPVKVEPAPEVRKPPKKAPKAAAQPPEKGAGEPPPEPPLPAAPPAAAPAEEPLPPKREVIPPGLSTQSLHLLGYLPGIYQTDFMSRFLALFESILVPVEWNIDNFDIYLDPETSPFGFLPWLANWYEILYDSSWSEEQRRVLLKEAYQIYARRGTRWALSRILEIYTGQKPEIIEFSSDGGSGRSEPFTFTVKLPPGNKNLNRELIERLIDSNKPAQTTYKLLY